MSGNWAKCAFLTKAGRIYVVENQRSFASSSDSVKAGEPFGAGFKLFENFDQMMTEREEASAKAAAEAERERRKQIEQEAIRADYRSKGVCQYCGGSFKKGLLGFKCTSCGRKKDY